jgi:hypothetical protein
LDVQHRERPIKSAFLLRPLNHDRGRMFSHRTELTCSPDVQELRNDTGPGLSPGPLLVDSKVGHLSKCSTNARKKLFTRAGGAEPRSHLSGGAAFLIAELRLYSGMRAHSGRIRQLGLQMRPSIEACGGNHESIFNSGNRRRLINTTGNKHYG